MKLGYLRPIYAGIGGYVSVYLDTDRAAENAPEEIALRWRAARQRLAEAGADEATLAAVGEVVNDPGRASPGRAVFARAGRVAFTAPMSRRPRREIARLAALPHLMPLLAQDPPPVAHLRVSATRAGGDMVAVDAQENVWADAASGNGWPIHKTSVGGWSQARFQRRAEEAWEVNAKELATQVTHMAKRVHAEVIVLAGDARARSLLLHQLGPLQAETLVVDQEVPSDSPPLAEAAARAIADRAGRECRRRFEEWPARLARGAGANGLADTMAALRDGRASDVFVLDRPTSTATAWVGPEGGDLAASEAELRERGVGAPLVDRADAAIVRAIATTDAQLHFLPEDLVEGPHARAQPLDGICASLRYPS